MVTEEPSFSQLPIPKRDRKKNHCKISAPTPRDVSRILDVLPCVYWQMKAFVLNEKKNTLKLCFRACADSIEPIVSISSKYMVRYLHGPNICMENSTSKTCSLEELPSKEPYLA